MKAASPSKRPHKRRKLVSSSTPSPTPSSSRVLTATTNANKPTNATPTCISCHRALNTQGNIIRCPICLSSTCAVCSRTCTDAPASQPPTPHLTRSPTPSPSPAMSPRRSVLSLSSPNTHVSTVDSPLTPNQNSVMGKRRKMSDDGALPSVEDAPLDEEYQGTSGPGCGRVVCRKCCYEDATNNTTTCIDCYSSWA